MTKISADSIVIATTPSDSGRNLLHRRVARLALLIKLEAPDIIIRNERRLIGEAMTSVIASAKSHVQPDTEETSVARNSDSRCCPAYADKNWAFVDDGLAYRPLESRPGNQTGLPKLSL